MSDIICYIYLGLMFVIGIFGVGYVKGTSHTTKEAKEYLSRTYSCDGCVYHCQPTQRCKTCKRGAIDRYKTASEHLSELNKYIQE